MRKLLFVLAAALAAAAIPSSTFADDQHPANRFIADLSAEDEVPPNDSHATGEATFHVVRHGQAIRYHLEINDIENVVVAHIHLGVVGQNGAVVVFLFGPVNPPQSGDVEVRGTFTEQDLVGPLQGHPLSELIAAIRSGGAYVNAHTTAHPAGEIRGQIVIDEDDDDSGGSDSNDD
jgi:hypothetical protein